MTTSVEHAGTIVKVRRQKDLIIVTTILTNSNSNHSNTKALQRQCHKWHIYVNVDNCTKSVCILLRATEIKGYTIYLYGITSKNCVCIPFIYRKCLSSIKIMRSIDDTHR